MYLYGYSKVHTTKLRRASESIYDTGFSVFNNNEVIMCVTIFRQLYGSKGDLSPSGAHIHLLLR